MVKRRKDPAKGNPRTGTGDKARGRKPQANECRIENKYGQDAHPDNRYRGSQPKGWGIAKVIDIITGKERKGGN